MSTVNIIGNLLTQMNTGDTTAQIQLLPGNNITAGSLIEIDIEGMIVTNISPAPTYVVQRGSTQPQHPKGTNVFLCTITPLITYLQGSGWNLVWAVMPSMQWTTAGGSKLVSMSGDQASYTFIGQVRVEGTQDDILNYLQATPQ